MHMIRGAIANIEFVEALRYDDIIDIHPFHAFEATS